jgi:hypothetical protein
MKNSRFFLDEILMTRYLGLNSHGLNVYTCLKTDISRRLLNVYRRLKMGEVADNQRDGRKRVYVIVGELRIYTS